MMRTDFVSLIAAAVHCQVGDVGSLLPSHTCAAVHGFHRPLQALSDESDNPMALIIKPRNSRIASKTAYVKLSEHVSESEFNPSGFMWISILVQHASE